MVHKVELDNIFWEILNNDKDLNDFLRHVLIFMRPDLEKKSTGSTFKAINKNVLETVSIPFGKKSNLLTIASRLEAINEIKKQVQTNIQSLKNMQKKLVNQIFG